MCTSEIISSIQEKGTFNPEKPRPLSEGELYQLHGHLIQAQEEIRVSPSTFYSWCGEATPLTSCHPVSHLQIAHAFSMSRARHLQKVGCSSLSHHCVHSLGWFLNVTPFVGHAVYIICWLNWERTIVVCLNLSWTKPVRQSDSCGWAINSRETYQNVYVRFQSLYLVTKIKGI